MRGDAREAAPDERAEKARAGTLRPLRQGDRAQHRPLEEPRAERAEVVRAQTGARLLEMLSVRNTRRALGLAGAAPEAQIEVARDRRGSRARRGGALPFFERAHEVEPPARVVHLGPERVVGRTDRKAEAAMDALVVDRGEGTGRRIARPGCMRLPRRARGLVHQRPPT